MDIEIHELDWDAWNEEHIAQHGVSRTDVEEICLGRRQADVAHGDRLRIIGRTSAGRVVVAILDPLGGGRYYCVTSFPATGRTRREFLDRVQRGQS